MNATIRQATSRGVHSRASQRPRGQRHPAGAGGREQARGGEAGHRDLIALAPADPILARARTPRGTARRSRRTRAARAARRSRSTSCRRPRCGARSCRRPASFGSTKYRKPTPSRMNSAKPTICRRVSSTRGISSSAPAAARTGPGRGRAERHRPRPLARPRAALVVARPDRFMSLAAHAPLLLRPPRGPSPPAPRPHAPDARAAGPARGSSRRTATVSAAPAEQIHDVVLAQVHEREPERRRVAEAERARHRPHLGEQERSHHGCGEVQRGHRGQGIASEHTVERAPAVSPEELPVLDHHPPHRRRPLAPLGGHARPRTRAARSARASRRSRRCRTPRRSSPRRAGTAARWRTRMYASEPCGTMNHSSGPTRARGRARAIPRPRRHGGRARAAGARSAARPGRARGRRRSGSRCARAAPGRRGRRAATCRRARYAHICSAHAATSRARERRTATHRPSGAAKATVCTSSGGAFTRLRTSGAATPGHHHPPGGCSDRLLDRRTARGVYGAAPKPRRARCAAARREDVVISRASAVPARAAACTSALDDRARRRRPRGATARRARSACRAARSPRAGRPAPRRRSPAGPRRAGRHPGGGGTWWRGRPRRRPARPASPRVSIDVVVGAVEGADHAPVLVMAEALGQVLQRAYRRRRR